MRWNDRKIEKKQAIEQETRTSIDEQLEIYFPKLSHSQPSGQVHHLLLKRLCL